MARGIDSTFLHNLKNGPISTFIKVVTRFGTFSENDNLLEIGSLETGTRIDGSGTSGNVSIKLNDTDRSLLNTYNTINLHSEPVWVYCNINNSYDILIFEGFIETPIVWDEKERTLSFEVITKTYDLEAGFAPEDGQFTNLKEEYIGKAWPLGFGTPSYVLATKIQNVPSSILLDPFGIPDSGLLNQITRLQLQYNSLQANYTLPYPVVIEDDENPGVPSGTTDFQGNDILTVDLEEYNKEVIANVNVVNQALRQVQTQRANIQQQIIDLNAQYNDQAAWLPGAQYRGGHGRKPGELSVSMEEFPEGKFLIKIEGTIFQGTFRRVPPADPNNPTPDEMRKGFLNIEFVPQNAFVGVQIGFVADINGTISDGLGGAFKYGFLFFNAGSTISIISEFKIPYVANIIPSTVLGVYGYRSYNGSKKLTKVPEDYYTISYGTPDFSNGGQGDGLSTGQYAQTGGELGTGDAAFNAVIGSATDSSNQVGPQVISNGWFQPVFINMKRALSLVSFFVDLNIQSAEQLAQYYEQVLGGAYGGTFPSHIQATLEWDDDIYVLYESSVGPNVCDIMAWIIQTFTTIQVDPTSFAVVRNYVDPYPANFVLTEKQDAYSLLQEIAFQARCALYIKENTFFIKYLPVSIDPVETITEDDIKEDTLQFTASSSDELITKFIAIWRPNYLPNFVDNKVVININVAKYGVRRDEHNYYIYNNHYSVKKSLTFWVIRKANIWKKIECKCFIDKLNIETLDTVLVNLSHLQISNTPVLGLVEEATLDLADNTIKMRIWLPILLGSNQPHPLAFPFQEIDVFPTVHEIMSGGGTQSLIDYQHFDIPSYTGGGPTEVGGIGATSYHQLFPEINTINRPDSFGDPLPNDLDQIPIIGIEGPTDFQPVNAPTYNYNLRDAIVVNPHVSAPPSPAAPTNTYPGQIVSGQGTNYQVKIYKKGVDDSTTTTVNVKQLQADPEDVIPVDTWVIVNLLLGKYYMQNPVWLGDDTTQ